MLKAQAPNENAWWLQNQDAALEDLLTRPNQLDAWLTELITNTVTAAAKNGTPNVPNRDTVRYGLTLFGDPRGN